MTETGNVHGGHDAFFLPIHLFPTPISSPSKFFPTRLSQFRRPNPKKAKNIKTQLFLAAQRQALEYLIPSTQSANKTKKLSLNQDAFFSTYEQRFELKDSLKSERERPE